MGFLDKAKEAANQALAATQQAAEKGQHKVTAMQQGRTEAQLYTALGQAFYAEQRHGGPTEAVGQALGALDAHFAEVAAQAAAAAQPGYTPPPTPSAGTFEQQAAYPPPTPPTPPPAG